LHRQWLDARSTILANAAPVADPIVPFDPAETAAVVSAIDGDGDGSVTLAESDAARTPDGHGPGTDGAVIPKASPADSRDSKRVY
jgi:hypothetical protein